MTSSLPLLAVTVGPLGSDRGASAPAGADRDGDGVRSAYDCVLVAQTLLGVGHAPAGAGDAATDSLPFNTVSPEVTS